MSEHTMEIEKQEAQTPEGVERTRPVRTFVPRVDIYETDNEVVLLADMPGVDENSVDITLEKNILTIQGLVEPHIPEGFEAAYREYEIGNYERAFSLSDQVDREGIAASVRSGVLRVVMPKADVARTRKIAVKAAS